MKHLTASAIASDYGFTARHWIRLAANGKVPGAYQPGGEGGKWLFDPVQFKNWFMRLPAAAPGTVPLKDEIDTLIKQIRPAKNATRKRKPVEGFIYIVTDRGKAKISFSKTPQVRIRSLETQAGRSLVVAAIVPGLLSYERKLHHKFREYRHYGEWFIITGELAEFLSDTDRNLKVAIERFRLGLT